ncbi:MAG: DinB family protein [Chloroflexi bacterium]|nr:DinB family protein [Chloroflexota bacterium]
MVADEQGLPIVAAVALRRADGRVLLVRHTDSDHPGAAEGRWTLPAEPVADDEVVETALARLLTQRLHLASDATEFSESVGLPGAIANVFTCAEWSGDPAYSADDYADAAWAAPHAPGGVDLPGGVREYLASAFPAPGPELPPRGDTPQAPPRGDTPRAPARAVPAVSTLVTGEPKNLIRQEAPSAAPPPVWSMTPDSLVEELEAARTALTDAYERFDEAWLDVTLDGDWAPVDLLAHCATVEAYYASESRRLAEEPGYTWQGFNPDQSAAERTGLPRPEDRATRARLHAVRADTLAWIETLDGEALAAYGNHAERGAVRIGERIERIARHDREHTEQLAAMLAATEADDEEDAD